MMPGKRERAMRAIALVALPMALLSACSSGDSDAPGSVSADEAAQLNDAAAMLDANSIDLNAVTTTNMDDAR